jgi:hypothetical protein
MKIKFFTLALLFLSLFASTDSAQFAKKIKTSKITLIVKDAENIPYGGMNIYIEGTGIEKASDNMATDEWGVFSTNLPDGRYTIKVNDSVYDYSPVMIDISAKKKKLLNIGLVVRMKSFCCESQGSKQATAFLYSVPPMPPTAKAVGATGEVIVAVKFDQSGKVISAKAETGHPLLRQVCEWAARQWVFSRDDTIPEREGKLIFAFPNTTRSVPVNTPISIRLLPTTKLRQPNRLEILTNDLEVKSSPDY